MPGADTLISVWDQLCETGTALEANLRHLRGPWHGLRPCLGRPRVLFFLAFIVRQISCKQRLRWTIFTGYPSLGHTIVIASLPPLSIPLFSPLPHVKYENRRKRRERRILGQGDDMSTAFRAVSSMCRSPTRSASIGPGNCDDIPRAAAWGSDSPPTCSAAPAHPRVFSPAVKITREFFYRSRKKSRKQTE